ncbi:probable imidazolonepropionase, partial [Oppia nitens]|uniref:probable imidazolonepropionase n=1 Tax=Oppia nitens TaxID=1686743 RepID=UPI0023D99ECB
MSGSAKIIIKNCEQIVQVCDCHESYKRGPQMDSLAIIVRRDDSIGCSLVIGFDGLIKDIGYDDQIGSKYSDVKEIIDGTNCCVIPGLIDSHSHPVFAGDRVFEFDAKTRGASYLSIHEKGGGIYHTVSQTQSATEQQLLKLLLSRIDNMMSCGTTVLECKSGYGLDLETETKMLSVINKANDLTSMDLVTTFLGAHAVPKGLSPQQGVKSVIEMMTVLKDNKFNIEFIDVFCEKGVYDVQQSEEILNAGKQLLNAFPGFHGEELNYLGSAEMAARVNARSVSHLEFIGDEGIKALSDNNIVGIVLPTTLYLLKLQSPPVRKMIDNNVIVAIGSDFNPNAMCFSLPMAMNLGVVKCGFTINESLAATTINAAYALNRSQTHGSLEIGKYGDCVVIDAPDWRHIVYEFGNSTHLIKHVIKNGN